jgi:hypothetical protein
MSGLGIDMVDLIGGLLGFLLTLCVFSYLLGDNGLFRFAIHIFIGVAAGFVAAMALHSVIFPQLLAPLIGGGGLDVKLWVLLPLLLSLLLVAKAFPRLSILGSPVMAFLVGVGAAVAVGGALLGTLFPQFRATTQLFDAAAIQASGKEVGFELLNGILILLGLVVTFASFQFNTGFIKNPSLRALWNLIYWSGRVFVAITFGVIFAGVYLASLAALTERLNSLWVFLLKLFSLAG